MKKYILFITTFFMVSACTEDRFSSVVDIEIPEHQPAISVNSAWTTQDTILKVLVSQSSPIIGEDMEVAILQNATVEVFKNDSPFEVFNLNTETGYFESQLSTPLADDGATYRIEVTEPNFVTVFASQTMPNAQFEIENLRFEEDGTFDSYGEKLDEVTFDIIDAEGEDYYAFQVRKYYKRSYDNGEFYENTYEMYPETIDTQLENADYGSTKLLRDVSFEGGRYRIQFGIWFNPDDFDDLEQKVLVYVSVLSKENYLYLRSLDQYWDAEDNPFAEPVVVFDNVEDGHGVFRIANTKVFEIEL